MNTHQKITPGAVAWQAAFATILSHFKSELHAARNTSVLSQQPIPRKLTTEACIMLCTILLFVILTVIGTSVTLYEKFKKDDKESDSTAKKRKKNGVSGVEEVKLHGILSLTGLKKTLKCFCIIGNAKGTFSTSPKNTPLAFLHGIKAISVLWAVIGHTFMMSETVFEFSGEILKIGKSKFTMLLYNGVIALDIFFILSAFLNAYSFCHRYDQRERKIPWVSFYVRRFLRISPLYFLVIGFYSTLFTYLGSGVVWPTYDTNPVCRENLIWLALYLNNFNSHMKQCLIHTWYLSCEMQLYIISPIFLLLLMRKPKTGYALLALCICGSCLHSFIYTMQYKLIDGPRIAVDYYPNNMGEFYRRLWEYFDMLHEMPFPRLVPYLTGLTLGHYVYRKRLNSIEQCSTVALTLGWIISAIFFWISMFSLHGREESTMEFAVYNGLKNLLFDCCAMWGIFVCATGHGGFLNKFLSSKVFIVPSTLSFATYLTHFVIIERYTLKFEELLEFSWAAVMQYFVPLWLQIFIVSAVVSVVFGAPMVRITESFFEGSKGERKPAKQ